MLAQTTSTFLALNGLQAVPHCLYLKCGHDWLCVYQSEVKEKFKVNEKPYHNEYFLTKDLMLCYGGDRVLCPSQHDAAEVFGVWSYNRERNVFNISLSPWREHYVSSSLGSKTDGELNAKVGAGLMRRGAVAYPTYLGEAWFYDQGLPQLVMVSELESTTENLRFGLFEGLAYDAQASSAEDNLTYLDPSSHLPNTYYYLYSFKERIAHCNTHCGELAIMVLDIKQWEKTLNAFGDQYVELLFRTLEKHIKQTFSTQSLLFMYNHSSLGLMLPVDDDNHAMSCARQLIAYFDTPWYFDDFVFFSSIRIGISLFPDHSRSPIELIRFADMALHSLEEGLNNDYAIFEMGMQGQISDNIKLFGDMRTAMDNHEFVMYYQPQVDLATEKIVGAEALIRWQHPVKGFIQPSYFIPAFGRLGSEYLLDQYVLDAVSRDQKTLQNHGLNDLSISLNLSASTLNTGTLDEDISDIIMMNGADPQSIVLEITESAAVFSSETVANRLFRLKQMGFRISIDDFGTGYSSLNYLVSLPIDAIKIDKVFTDGYLEDEKKAFLFKKIDEIAEHYNLDMTIEGVEKEAQIVAFKRDMQKHVKIQGFYYYKPMPFEELIQLINKQKREGGSHA